MNNFDKLTEEIVKFRDERDWKKFHNPKDCAISLVLEAAEVLEHFQWKNENEVAEYLKEYKEHIAKEIADVLYWVLLMSHDLDIDLSEVSERKLEENRLKYPIEKAKGNHHKYSDL